MLKVLAVGIGWEGLSAVRALGGGGGLAVVGAVAMLTFSCVARGSLSSHAPPLIFMLLLRRAASTAG